MFYIIWQKTQFSDSAIIALLLGTHATEVCRILQR